MILGFSLSQVKASVNMFLGVDGWLDKNKTYERRYDFPFSDIS